MNHAKKRKHDFLRNLESGLDLSELCVLIGKTSFSFQFLDVTQEHGIGFSQFNSIEQLSKFCDKLKDYCRESLSHWEFVRIGQGKNHVLEIYGSFPSHSNFQKPKHVPQNVKWARFRLEGDFRLAGFVVDEVFSGELKISKNTFYVVFIDPHHNFYPQKR